MGRSSVCRLPNIIFHSCRNANGGKKLAVKKRDDRPERDKRPRAHFMVPFSRNEMFTGSSQLYNRLKKVGTGRHLRLALYGLGGIGYVEIFAIFFLAAIC